MDEYGQNEVWHALMNAERMIRVLRKAVLSGDNFAESLEDRVNKTLEDIEEVKYYFLSEEDIARIK